MLRKQGSVPISEFPYDPKDCARQPDRHDLTSAQRNRIGNFVRIDTSRPDDAKGALAQHRPVAIGMWIDFAGLGGLKPDAVYDQVGNPHITGHALLLAGYDDARGAFRVLNSWGENWADHGYGWISYRSFLSNTDAAYAVTDAIVPSLPPDVTPAPVVPAPAVSRWSTDVATAAAGLPCTRITVDAAQRRVTGHAGSPADRDRLQRLLPADVTFDVAVRPWPQCEALETLDATQPNRPGLTVEPIGHANGVYRAGGNLALRIQMPDAAGYLHLAYIDAAGDAMIAYPAPGTAAEKLSAGSSSVNGLTGSLQRARTVRHLP